jgi:hypothetical protein
MPRCTVDAADTDTDTDGDGVRPPPTDHSRAARRSLVRVLATLVVVLGLVGAVAVVSRGAGTIGGNALPAPGTDVDVVSDPAAPAVDPAAPRTAPAVPGRLDHPRPALDRALEGNPLLYADVRLAEVNCELPVLGRTEESLRAFYEAGVGCLDDAWAPAIEQIGRPFETAGLELSATAATTCSDAPAEQEAVAFYCGTEHVIYLPSDRMLQDAGFVRGYHLAILAHEYGHHVQMLSGIMLAADDEMWTAEKGSAEAHEITRRMELQANCFAGLFIAGAAGRSAVTDAVAATAMTAFDVGPDSDTHGSTANQRRWARAGFEGKGPADCNTWVAPSAEVA